MFKYILKRIFLAFISILTLLVLVFFLMNLSGKSPINPTDFPSQELYEERYKQLELDQNVVTRFFKYLSGFFQFDFGQIYKPIGGIETIPELFFSPLKYTITITSISFLISVLIGVSLGYIAGYNSGKKIDNIISFFVIMFSAIPSFIFASVFLLIGPEIGLKTQFLDPDLLGISLYLESLIAPIIVMSLGSIAVFTYYTRNEIKSILTSEYIINARSKGLSSLKIFTRYVFRNSLIPIISIVVPFFVILLGGSLIIETFFGIPGASSIIISAIKNNETNIVMFNAIFFGAISIFLRILIDISYVIIDPRITYEMTKIKNYGIFNKMIRKFRKKNDQILSYNFYKKGKELYDNSLYEEALNFYEKALEIYPNYSIFHDAKGLVFYQLKNYEKAIENFDYAIEIQHDYIKSFINKGKSLVKLQNFNEALEIYDEAFKINSNDFLLLKNKANLLMELKKYQEAIILYSQAIKIKEDPNIYYQKSIAFNKIGKISKAKIYFDKFQKKNKEVK